MSKQLYLISGMGADERVFRHLQFPPGYTVHYLPWIKPLPAEPLSGYAARMAQGITGNGPVALLGLSFGGMLSLEIARQRPIEKIILVSTIKHTRERPLYFNLARALRLYRLSSPWIYRQRSSVVKHFLNAETPEEQELVTDYLRKNDFDYMHWAIRTVVCWENDHIPPGVVHIHGNADLTFPIKYITPDYTIQRGGHFMIMNHAPEINRILSREL
jgi:pimeloyl-ACP methyl ester carboxylesterase